MDVVVRTPHGDADIDIVAAPAATTLAELLRAVTGQAAPATTRVDGRAITTTRPLADLDLVIGSLIDTRPEPPAVPAQNSNDAAVGLIQLTGRGAGTSVRLDPGRYRIGSSRRLHADELHRAPVETAAFDIEVGERRVQLTPGPDIGGALGAYTPTLGAQLFDRKLVWNGERLSVGGRLFDLDVPFRGRQRRRLAPPADDGTIAFQRSSGATVSHQRVVVDAIVDAMNAGTGLWARRQTEPGAFDVPFGVHADTTTSASVDLQRHRGVALVGSESFTFGLARTLLVELATMHGPADLDVVIATAPEHVAQWNWAKWLPHVRCADPASPSELFDEPIAMGTWAASMVGSDRAGPGPNPLTLLVLDDVSLWSRRDSPIRPLLVDPPPELRIVARCVGLHEAPGMCTSLIEEVAPIDRLAHLSSVTAASGLGRPALFGSLATQHTYLDDGSQVVADIRPALVEISLAAELARTLAPLDDLDARHRAPPPEPAAAPTLAGLVALAADTSRIIDPPTSSLPVPIGVHLPVAGNTSVEQAPVTVDLAASLSTIVLAADPALHDRAIAAMLLGAAAQRPPDELAILDISRGRPAWHNDLAHITDWAGRSEAEDASRLIHRIAYVLGERPDLHVLVVIERAFDANDPMPTDLVTGMTELAESLSNMHVVLTGDHPDSVPDANRTRCGALAWVDNGGAGQIWIGDRQIAFDAAAPESAEERPTAGPTGFDAPELLIRPTTQGRSMTPLERRLTRSSVDGTASVDSGDLAAATIARQITNRFSNRSNRVAGPSLLPPPLPATVEFSWLLARHQGDGVPIGLVDRPERAENEAYWWQPASRGSILAAGSPRSGMTSLLDLIVCGVAARISADDLHLYAIEALPQRRRAFEALPHTGDVATPDEPDAVRRLVGGLHQILLERIGASGNSDRADIVLLVGDVGRMVRALPADVADSTMQLLGEIVSARPSVGIDVIAVASHVDDLGPLIRLTGDRLVGATTDPADRTRLGAPDVGVADRQVGRCWSTATQRQVQLATPPDAVDAEIARLAPEPAQHRPPAAIIDGIAT